MSLSSGGGAENPTTMYLQWKSTEKSFVYYDRDKKENIKIEMPFYIVPLDVLGTIKGFHESSMSQIYSNEVKSVNKEELDVRSFKGGRITKGLYKNIKTDLQGGKYSNSIYAALIIGKKRDEVEMININLTGAALGAYIDANIKTDGSVIEVVCNPEQQKKGAVKYFIPQFNPKGVTKEIKDMAIGLDESLQAYLKSKRESSVESAESVKTNETVREAVAASGGDAEENDLPF